VANVDDTETATAIDRAVALEAVLSHAPDMGIDRALEQFGGSLTATERKLVSSLTRDELQALQAVEGKLAAVQARKANNNNNNNNKPK